MQGEYHDLDDIPVWEHGNNNDLKKQTTNGPSGRSSSLDALPRQHTSSSLNGDDLGSESSLSTDSDLDCWEYKRKTCVVKLDGRQYTIGKC